MEFINWTLTLQNRIYCYGSWVINLFPPRSKRFLWHTSIEHDSIKLRGNFSYFEYCGIFPLRTFSQNAQTHRERAREFTHFSNWRIGAKRTKYLYFNLCDLVATVFYFRMKQHVFPSFPSSSSVFFFLQNLLKPTQGFSSHLIYSWLCTKVIFTLSTIQLAPALGTTAYFHYSLLPGLFEY